MAEQQRAILRLTGPDVPQDTIEITEKGLKIGRLAANDLPLQHQKISRFHAEIKFSAEGLVITDLGSSNGSFVGDTQLVPDMPYVLSLGDGIRLGPFVLAVEEISTQPPAGAPLDVTIAAGVSRQDIEAALKEAEAVEEAARVAAERQAQEEAEAKAKAEAEEAAKEAKRKAEEEKAAQEAAAKAKAEAEAKAKAEADKAAKEAADKAKADAKKSSKKETAAPPVVETPPEPAIEPAPETQGAQKTEPTGERPVAEKTPEPEADVTLVKAEEKSEPLPEPTVVPSEELVVETEDKAEAGVEELGPPENEAPPEPAQPAKVEKFKPSAPTIPPRVPLIALSNGHLPPAIPGIPADVSSWLQYLPPIYQEDMFTGRFLLIFESIGAPIEWILDHFDFFFDPRYAPEEWLQWFGSWVDVVIPDNLPEERQRAIVSELAPLFLRRGTPQSLSRHLELVFDVIPDIKEPEKPPSTFEVILKLGKSGDTDDNRRLATRIIEAHRPAHTQFTLTIK